MPAHARRPIRVRLDGITVGEWSEIWEAGAGAGTAFDSVNGPQAMRELLFEALNRRRVPRRPRFPDVVDEMRAAETDADVALRVLADAARGLDQ